MTSQRIVARGLLGPLYANFYAANARLTLWTRDRDMAHRFPDAMSAWRVCENRCRTVAEEPGWIDRVLLGAYHVLHPTVDDAARTLVDNIERHERSRA